MGMHVPVLQRVSKKNISMHPLLHGPHWQLYDGERLLELGKGNLLNSKRCPLVINVKETLILRSVPEPSIII
jgi:hypothetical protein